MASVRCKLAGTLSAILLAGSAGAVAPGEHVDNFALLDQNGKFHDLYYLSDAKAVVLMTHNNDCRAVQDALPALEQAKAAYGGRGVEFLMINAEDARAAIAASGAASGIPVLVDERRLVSESMQLNRASEVLVIDPKGWKVAYRGPVATKKDNLLTGALDAVLAGQAVKKSKVAAKGCSIKLAKAGAPGRRVSYSNEIAPLLIDNCVTCHRAGGIGPFAMTDYNVIRGFAPMIREVVRTKRMPPWHADPHVGVFEDARALTREEAQTLVHWIEAGAPRGKGADTLAEYKKTWAEWSFGKPDLIVELPAMDVPATGTVDYQFHVVPNTTGRDVWVRASDTIPGDRTVLHHVLSGVFDPALPERQREVRATSGELGGYVPGNGPVEYPAETGVLVRKDQSFAFQVHYTTSGKASRDVTRVGLYFHDAPPKYEFKTAVIANPRIKIPANTKAHTESMVQDFPREVLMYSLTPHSHYRGRASNFVAKYPDGREELLLSVPKYDFNWQTTYSLAEPKVVPAGTKIVHSTTYDNSTQNPANPDPNRVVPWGLQSWDEMLYGVVRYREMTPDAKLSAAE
ncbi:MAG: redoxin domain-containing protein [Steroidobacter sp.]